MSETVTCEKMSSIIIGIFWLTLSSTFWFVQFIITAFWLYKPLSAILSAQNPTHFALLRTSLTTQCHQKNVNVEFQIWVIWWQRLSFVTKFCGNWLIRNSCRTFFLHRLHNYMDWLNENKDNLTSMPSKFTANNHPADKCTMQLSAQHNRNTSSRLIAIIILCFRLEDLQPEPTETNDPTNKFQ